MAENELGQVGSILDRKLEEYRKKFDELQQKIETQQKELDKVIEKGNKNIEKIETENKNKLEEIETENKNKLEAKIVAIEKLYISERQFEASVKFWEKKRKHHQIVMWSMGVVTIIFAVLALVGFWEIYNFLFSNVDDNTPTPHLFARASIMLAISSLGIWLVRLSSKIFISNLHLRTDADERVTMIQTYLALILEDNALSDDDRYLILQAIFRPSSKGFIKEEGPVGFYETVPKSLGKPKG